MAQLGDIILQVDGAEARLKPLTVRQLATMQRRLGALRAQRVIEDAKELGVEEQKVLQLAMNEREQACLTSSVIRWCFETEGAFTIVKEALGGDEAMAERVASTLTPDELTQHALLCLGFEWDDSASKLVSRSARNGGATGSTNHS